MKKKVLALMVCMGLVSFLGGCYKNETVLLKEEEKKQVLSSEYAGNNEYEFMPLGYSNGDIYGFKYSFDKENPNISVRKDNLYTIDEKGELTETAVNIAQDYGRRDLGRWGNYLFNLRGFIDWRNGIETKVIDENLENNIYEKMEKYTDLINNSLSFVKGRDDLCIYRVDILNKNNGTFGEIVTIVDLKNKKSYIGETRNITENGLSNYTADAFYDKGSNSLYLVDYLGNIKKCSMENEKLSTKTVGNIKLDVIDYVSEISYIEGNLYVEIRDWDNTLTGAVKEIRRVNLKDFSSESMFKSSISDQITYVARDVGYVVRGKENGRNEYGQIRFSYTLGKLNGGKIDFTESLGDDKDDEINAVSIYFNEVEKKGLVKRTVIGKEKRSYIKVIDLDK